VRGLCKSFGVKGLTEQEKTYAPQTQINKKIVKIIQFDELNPYPLRSFIYRTWHGRAYDVHGAIVCTMNLINIVVCVAAK
jgi:hypothetical protein